MRNDEFKSQSVGIVGYRFTQHRAGEPQITVQDFIAAGDDLIHSEEILGAGLR